MAATVNSSAEVELKITPSVLNFPPPLNRVVKNQLVLKNESEHFVAFKVKTTAPKRYCVRPNLGIVPPTDSSTIQVLLNYVKDASSSTKDRFQVQSVPLTGGSLDNDDLKQLWAEVDPDDVSKQRLKVTFMPESDVQTGQKEEPAEGPITKQAQTSAKETLSDSSADKITQLNKQLDRVSKERDQLRETFARQKSSLEQLEKTLRNQGKPQVAKPQVRKEIPIPLLLIIVLVCLLLGRLSGLLI